MRETDRKLGQRLGEHKKDPVQTPPVYTLKAESRASNTSGHSSAVTSHITRKHCNRLGGVKVIDKEDNKSLRKSRDPLYTEGEADGMNKDEVGYQISLIFRPLFTTVIQSSSKHAQ